MKSNDSSRRVASKRLVLATETVKTLGVRTGVQTGLAIGVGSGGGTRTAMSCAGACVATLGFCQTV